MADVLSVLREAVMAGSQGTLEPDHIVLSESRNFPGAKISRKAPSSFICHSDPSSRYSAEECWFLVSQGWEGKVAAYVTAARKNGIKTIAFEDRQELTEYLTGVRSTSTKISTLKRPLSDDVVIQDPKRVAVEDKVEREPVGAMIRERPTRTRNHVLSAQKGKKEKGFSQVLDTIDRIKKIVIENQEKEKAARNALRKRYDATEDDPGYLHDIAPGADNFSINTKGTFSLAVLSKQDDIEKVQREREIARQKELEEARQRINPSLSLSLSNIIPIIMVPSASSAIVNSYNAKEFLVDQKYSPVTTTAIRGPAKIERSRDPGRTAAIAYELCDDPKKLSPEDWNRVIGVIVQGKKWQFKDWPWGEPAVILAKVPGVHIRFHDEKLDPLVKDWNVKQITIHRSRREEDTLAVRQIWSTFDAFVMRNYPAYYQGR